MAVSDDPLRRTTLGVVAQAPGARVQGPEGNSALQLAQAFRSISPKAEALMGQVAKDRAEKERAQAKKDALEASGALLADAVREGKIKATQNPWYIQAYNREAAAIRAQDGLQKLQVDSASWEEQTDPEAFATKWREEVGKLSEGFDGEDFAAGFVAAEGVVSSQVLQTNVAKNSARIQSERRDNLSSLAVDALQTSLRTKGGGLTPNDAWNALAPVRQQWIATGGSIDDWNQIVVSAVTATAYGAKDKTLLDLLKAPELAHGPSDAGEIDRVGAGDGYPGAVVSETSSEAPPVPPQVNAPKAPPTLKIDAPLHKGFVLPLPLEGEFSSGYGPRKAPKKGASTNHLGLDIKGAVGDPVKAQAVGKVIKAGKQGGYGNRVEIDYGNGVVVSLSHLSKFSVKPGDIVHPGQVVAAVGKTGVATGPHLHYEVLVNGKKVDPRSFKGSIGGSFEGQQALPVIGVPDPVSLAGFPGQDKPFSIAEGAAYAQPANQYGRGPSLYGLPGVADKVEADRYRISEAAQAATLERMRDIEAKRTARGYEAQDYLLNKYGTGILTGAVARDTIMADLNGKGYSAPEIMKTLSMLRDGLSDSVGLANAQVEARQQNPGVAKAILDIQMQGATAGYSDAYGSQVAGLILSGDISREDASAFIGTAITRTRQLDTEARQDAAEVRAEARQAASEAKQEEAQKLVNGYSDLKQQAGIMTAFVVTKSKALSTNPAWKRNIDAPETRAIWERAIADAMAAHLAANPQDWDGALAIGQAAAGSILTRMQANASRSASAKATPSGGNPRK